MRRQVAQAKAAGIDGFIVSWKDLPVNNRRLEALMTVARSMSFKLAVIYEGLNFGRAPLPVRKVGADLQMFLRDYAATRCSGSSTSPWSSGPAPGSSPPGTSSGSPDPCGVRCWCSPRRRAHRATNGWPAASTATRTTGRRSTRRPTPATRPGSTAMSDTVHRSGGPVDRAVRPGLRRAPGGRHQGGAPPGRRHAAPGVRRRGLLLTRRPGPDLLERVQREHARRAQPEERGPVPLRPLGPLQGRRGPGVAVGRGLQRGSGGRRRRPDRAARPRRVRRPPAARRRSPLRPQGQDRAGPWPL